MLDVLQLLFDLLRLTFLLTAFAAFAISVELLYFTDDIGHELVLFLSDDHTTMLDLD